MRVGELRSPFFAAAARAALQPTPQLPIVPTAHFPGVKRSSQSVFKSSRYLVPLSGPARVQPTSFNVTKLLRPLAYRVYNPCTPSSRLVFTHSLQEGAICTTLGAKNADGNRDFRPNYHSGAFFSYFFLLDTCLNCLSTTPSRYMYYLCWGA